MSKRPSLAESMKAVAAPPLELATQNRSQAAEQAPEQSELRPKGFYAATRLGKKKATTSMNPAAHRQLKELALDHGGIEKLLTEAINDVFRKYGKQPIA